MADQQSSTKRVAVCGGGLVGALNACFLARRGFTVELFEMRPDIRKQEVVRGRSINLAVAVRGLEALRSVGLEDRVVQKGIPMYSRMIHDPDGTLRQIPYGKGQQNIMAVDRQLLNEVLLDAAEQYPNVKTHFNHKVVRCDFEAGEIVFIHEGREVEKTVDLIVGADGAFSAVRQQMMKRPELLFDLQQHYIPHGYMELTIPPTQDGQFAMRVNYLHIWPRNDFMMIALPNLDKSFTANLFMPFEQFNSLQTEDQLVDFFRETFPDAVPLLGESNLKKTFFESKAQSLVTVKCQPYHVGDKAVIIGDAAHAMVPFYGQGMNCGFEDCIVLDNMLDKYNDDFAKALPAYTEFRNPDAKAICDLAMCNYIVMRASVNSRSFLFRRKLDNLLHWAFPSFWLPLYTSVSFSRMPYHQCIENRAWQDKILTNICLGAAGTLAASVLIAMYTQMGSHGNGALPQLVSKLSGRVFP
ncbi:kynurenine 3-monooxygenase-like [Babylonia areolata]|uniref:kynurenine 3-monooxygenase-like n=1 Tax=Babylonia areolata TaxID=304850 RepID=UPI003FD06863